mmetsp:Transcript_79528/g.229984  ORF Transcript_79528/g.229984 Transcript_79528/m.229984 type:complete len:867 (-) Transcript_79528:181-2781(-)
MGQKCCAGVEAPLPGTDLFGEAATMPVVEDATCCEPPSRPLWQQDMEEHAAREAAKEALRMETEANQAKERAAAEARAEEERQKAKDKAAAERYAQERADAEVTRQPAAANAEERPVKKTTPRSTAKSKASKSSVAKVATQGAPEGVNAASGSLSTPRSQEQAQTTSKADSRTTTPRIREPSQPVTKTDSKGSRLTPRSQEVGKVESKASTLTPRTDDVGKIDSKASPSTPRTHVVAKFDSKASEVVSEVNIVGAKNLRNADNFGQSDPFCVCEILGMPESRFQTRVIDDNPNPLWNHCVTLCGFTKKDKLKFQVWDKDTFSANDTLGQVEIGREQFYPHRLSGDLELHDTGGKVNPNKKAVVHVEIEVIASRTVDKSEVEVSVERFVDERLAEKVDKPKLIVTILSAKGLRNADSGTFLNGVSDPYCVCEIPTKHRSQVRTPVVKDNLNPVWNYSAQVHCYEPGDSLYFAVKDKDYIKTDDVLGHASLSREQVEKGGLWTLELQDANNSAKAVLKVKVKTLGASGSTAALEVKSDFDSRDSDKENTDAGSENLEPSKIKASTKSKARASSRVMVETLKINVVGAKNLRNADNFGQSDPFCVCEIAGKPESRFQTRVVDDNASPIWNHCMLLHGFTSTERLRFEVWDEDTFSANDLLGVCEISRKLFYPLAFVGEIDLSDSDSQGSARSGQGKLQVEIEVVQSERASPDKQVKTYLEKHSTDRDARRKMSPTFGTPGKLMVTFISAKGLRNADIAFNGLSDPYCVCEIPGKANSRVKTPVIKDSLEPVWNYTTQVQGYEHGDSLSFAVLDKDLAWKSDDVLGRASLSKDKIERGWSGVLELKDSGANARASLKVKVEMLKASSPQA